MAAEDIALKAKFYFLPGRGDRKVGRVIEDGLTVTIKDMMTLEYLSSTLSSNAKGVLSFLGGRGGKWGRCILLLAIAVNIHSKSKLIF